MVLTPENIHTLSTDDLQEIVWEMYKEINGIRPRFMSTREDYIQWLSYELQPEVLVQRQAERADEANFWAEFEKGLAEERAREEAERAPLGYMGEAYERLDVC